MATLDEGTVEISHLVVTSQARYLASPCKVTQQLLEKLQTSIDLSGKTLLDNIRECGQAGCKDCWLVWHGVSTVMRTAVSSNSVSWDTAIAFGMILENNDGLEA